MSKHLNSTEKKTGDLCQSHKDGYTEKIFLSLEDINKMKKRKNDLYRLTEIYTNFFNTEYLGNWSCYTKEGKQCSDGSDLYTLVKYEGKDVIVKVGAGEFNTQVFTTSGVPEIRSFYHSPIPLFVVNQGDSYLGSNEDRINRSAHPKQYLNECAVIVVPKGGEAHFRGSKERNEKDIDYGPIHIRHYEDVLLTGRLAILQKTFPNGSFEKAVAILDGRQGLDFDAFYSKVYKNEEYLSNDDRKLLGCLWNMSISTVGCGVGDKKAFLGLYNLIQSFDIHKKVFTLSASQHE